MKAGSVLVLGGARSGKSRYAEDLALKSGLKRIYVATAQAYDEEMRDRIGEHRSRRGGDWTTIEAPLDLAAGVEREAHRDRVVLVDCLTLWLSNHLLEESDIERQCHRLADCVPALPGLRIFVSNEVGSGIVPENRLARDFRDAQGGLNQMMAAVCDQVILVVAGLPLTLKGSELS